MQTDEFCGIEIRFERIPYDIESLESPEIISEEIEAQSAAHRARPAIPRIARMDAQVLFRLTRRRAQFGIIH